MEGYILTSRERIRRRRTSESKDWISECFSFEGFSFEGFSFEGFSFEGSSFEGSSFEVIVEVSFEVSFEGMDGEYRRGVKHVVVGGRMVNIVVNIVVNMTVNTMFLSIEMDRRDERLP